LLVITAAWTGCRWGELAGLHRDNVDLRRGVIVIDPLVGALHESGSMRWLGPPKTRASARTIASGAKAGCAAARATVGEKPCRGHVNGRRSRRLRAARRRRRSRLRGCTAT